MILNASANTRAGIKTRSNRQFVLGAGWSGTSRTASIVGRSIRAYFGLLGCVLAMVVALPDTASATTQTS
ncbi:MAG TPA: hypothetical protein VMI53_04315, partial [Opitutaceae bacterium]|nr:hypothetical protein [Opitutaceae bacterium]